MSKRRRYTQAKVRTILTAFARENHLDPRLSESVDVDQLLQREVDRIQNFDPTKTPASVEEIVNSVWRPRRMIQLDK